MNADSLNEFSSSSPSNVYTPSPIPEYQCEILPDDFTKYNLSFKLIVIGDSGVGKSCLTNKATRNVFDEYYNPTVGFEFFSFNLRIDDRVIKMQIWDTCGQELYRSLITNFYRNSSLAVMVYSITNKDSFDNIDVWLKELKMHSNPDVKVFVIGNKMDLEKDRKVDFEQGVNYTKENGLDLFMESSAKIGINVQKIFIDAAKVLYADYLKYKDKRVDHNISEMGSMTSEHTMKISKSTSHSQQSKCGC